MIDFHSHILYGIDDGSSDIEESIEIIKKMRTLGFDKIILTPHYIVDSKYSAKIGRASCRERVCQYV